MQTADGDIDHALLEVSHLDTAGVVLKLDLVLDGAGVMIGKSGMQV